MNRFDIIQATETEILAVIPSSEVALFNGEAFFTVISVAQALKVNEVSLLKILSKYEFVSVDLELDERLGNFVVHDGQSDHSRALVMGVTWQGLKCLAMELETPETLKLARELIMVDFEFTNPQRLAYHYSRLKAKSIGLKK